MCGIFAIVRSSSTSSDLISGLKRLEYRGYDSSGIACLNAGEIEYLKAKGKISALEEKLKKETIDGNIGIAHTRWATHGPASEKNSHPHISENFAVVHNGIIENFKRLRTFLENEGYNFKSDTDTEVIPHLLEYNYKKLNGDLLQTVKSTLAELKGAFAVAILCKHAPDSLIAAKNGSPLCIGKSEGESFIGSDAYVMAPYTNKICYLKDNNFAFLNKDNVKIYDVYGHEIEASFKLINFSNVMTGKENYRHFMHKEIEEQPTIIADVINTYFDRIKNRIFFDNADLSYQEIDRITIIACGTSAYAGEIAKFWFEKYAKVPVTVELASEFIYKNFVQNDDLFIFISQSGETADSLKALKLVKAAGKKTLLLVNAEQSSMQNESDDHIFLHAGPEIGVASTKAFTAQLTVLLLLSLKTAVRKNVISQEEKLEKCKEIRSLPKKINKIIKESDNIRTISQKLTNIANIIYIGRGKSYGLAKEAALKFKEISYIPAEGIAAGELKHGPIALIDEDLYVVVLIPDDELFAKTYSNIEEISARGGKIIAITDNSGAEKLKHITDDLIILPESTDLEMPIIYSLPIQYLAYYTAVSKGTDVDQPRNLAKSVTVE